MHRMRVVLILALPAVAEPTAPASPGSRYTDPLHGFSIQRPEGSRVVRQAHRREMVQFLLPDPAGGPAPIRVSLLEVSRKGAPVTDLAGFARALADHLLVNESFKADPARIEIGPTAGCPSLVLAGSVGGEKFGLYRRDIWLQVDPTKDPRRFLILRTTGPMEAAERVTALSRSSAATLRVFDAEKTRAALEKDLARGAKALSEAAPPTIRRILAQRDYWLAIVRDGKTVGFVHVTEAPAARNRTEGIRVVTEMAYVGANRVRTLIRDDSYAAFDRSLERWEFFSVEVDGDVERNRHHEFGLQQDQLLVVQTVVGPHHTRSHQREIPRGIYLPKTLGVLAPRLIDRSKPGSWAFAQYDPATREVEMRTLTVKGPQSIKLGGKTFKAVEMTDRLGLGAPTVTMFLDAAGLPLKVVRPDGSVFQQTTGEAIRARFERELQMLQPVAP